MLAGAAAPACSSVEAPNERGALTDPGATTSSPPPPSTPDSPAAGTPTPPGGGGETGGPYAPLFVGRFDTTDPAGPRAAWPGARVLARFEGTAVSVRLRELAEPWMEGAPSFWEARIDDGAWKAIEMIPDDAPHDFAIAQDLAPGPHRVELYKRSETQTGITQFLGFDLHGGRTLPSPPRQARKIEVMGDSQSTGFGIEMLNAPNHDCPGADHGGRWQNFRKAWGAIVGERFDAEVHGVVYSGKGVVQNVWPTDGDTLIRYYARANPNPALQNSNPPLFDLKSWVPDVIVMAQGAMDFNSGVDYGLFRAAYKQFIVDTLRARGAGTHIFMAVLGRGGRGSIPTIAQEIIDERASLGDDKLHVFVAKDYDWTEMVACNGHGTPGWHQRIAGELAAEITNKVGWP